MQSSRVLVLLLLAACSLFGSAGAQAPGARVDTMIVIVDGRGEFVDTTGKLAAVLDREIQVVACPPTRYPEALRRAGIRGRVTLEFIIDTLGRPELNSLRAVESPHDSLTHAARATVLGCTFTAGRVRGRAMRVLLRLPLEFKLSVVPDTSRRPYEPPDEE